MTARASWSARALCATLWVWFTACNDVEREQATPDAGRHADSGSARGPGKRTPGPVTLHAHRTIEGDVPWGEVGFRFGSPRDVDGDDVPDVAAGARFAEFGGRALGRVSIWSGASGARLHRWNGTEEGALFGHDVRLLPDLDGDDLADLIVSTPQAVAEPGARGEITAQSPARGKQLWTARGERFENFGWHLEPTDDHNGDGVGEVLVGCPIGPSGGNVALVDGADGTILRRYRAGPELPQFGWYVTTIEDLDGDGLADMLVGAPEARGPDGEGEPERGAALLLSTGTGEHLRRFDGDRMGAALGEMLSAVPDVDGDGVADLAISATHIRADDGPLTGQVRIYSSVTGRLLETLEGKQEGELFGRFIGPAGDIDGDAIDDIVIGAPWAGAARQGRFEVRSGADRSLLMEQTGQEPDSWLGWHAAPTRSVSDANGHPGAVRNGLLVAAIFRSPGEDLPHAGALVWYKAEGP